MAESALGFLLRSLREERGLSLRELSQLAGVDHAYIYRLETGAKEAPSDQILSKLLRALKPGKREAEMLRYLASYPKTEAALVAEALKDPSVTYDIFTATAGMAFRGTARPDYATLIARVRRILLDENGDG
jgi:transcriptional regulator with XRE-family HTH domain